MEIRYQDVILRDQRLSDIADEIRWMNEETAWMKADTPWETFEPVDEGELRAYMTENIENMPEDCLRHRLEIEQDGRHLGFVCAYPLGENYEALDFDKITEGTRTICALGIELCEPDSWGRGIGTGALAAFMDYYRSNGVHAFALETWSGNARMIRSARKLGFTEVRRDAGVRIVDGISYDALVLAVDRNGLPTRQEAETLLKEAEACNPGPWGNHSRVAAMCGEKIALACGMDGEKAYILGLMHDIGRKFGVKHLGHVYDGWKYMLSLGYDRAARSCLTHSFVIPTLAAYIGNMDITDGEQAELTAALAATPYDDYDRLIQLCDCLAGAAGVVDMEARMADVKRRYGSYPQEKWDGNMALKRYFEEKSGKDIYEIVK